MNINITAPLSHYINGDYVTQTFLMQLHKYVQINRVLKINSQDNAYLLPKGQPKPICAIYAASTQYVSIQLLFYMCD